MADSGFKLPPPSSPAGTSGAGILHAVSRASSAAKAWPAQATGASWKPGSGVAAPRPAEHGDHFYPRSEGGSTSLQNFVAACARCNRAKRARIPSPGQQRRDGTTTA
ncbi:HNH endonuclease [Pseudarthrobacter sp. CCNWLW207]|uniref:HNH endonuclease n=1 Tax=Pseudarthrobacter sp. CCNWLW207 TaxID=3127468 RepID=UPI003077ACE0